MHKLMMRVLQGFVLLLTLLIAAVGFAAPLQPSTNANNTEGSNADLNVTLANPVNVLGVYEVDDNQSAWWRDWEQANALRPKRYAGDSFVWWRDWEHANNGHSVLAHAADARPTEPIGW